MTGRLRQGWTAVRRGAGGRALQLITQTYLVTLIGLAVGICSARSLSVAERGTLALLLLAAQLISRLGSLGFEQLLQKHGLSQFSLGAFYRAAAAGCLVLLPLTWAFVHASALPPALILTTGAAAFVVAALRIHTALLIWADQFRALLGVNLTQAGLQLLLFVVAFGTHQYAFFYGAWLVTVTVSALLSLRLIWGLRTSAGRPAAQPARAVWQASHHYASVAFPETVIAFCLELPLVRLALGEVSAGLYAISNTLTNIYFQIFTALSAVAIRQPLRSRLLLYPAVAGAGVVLALIMTPLTTLLFGPKYAGAAAYAHWMLPATFCLGVARLEQVMSARPLAFRWQVGLAAAFCVALGAAALNPHPAWVVPGIAACYALYALALLALTRRAARTPPPPSAIH